MTTYLKVCRYLKNDDSGVGVGVDYEVIPGLGSLLENYEDGADYYKLTDIKEELKTLVEVKESLS